MATLSLDVTFEILCRLGVKDLLRFRCVSRSWCSFIDGRDFIKLHLSHSLKSNTNRFLVSQGVEIMFVNFDSLEIAQKLKPPRGNITIGSCHGLVVLLNHANRISLWNPLTRKCRELPFTGFEFSAPSFNSSRAFGYGLGYDLVSDDYKLVRMVQLHDGYYVYKSEVKVYSLRRNSWRRIKEFPYHLQDMYGVFANNALHWVVSKEPKRGQGIQKYILAFDLGTEENRFVELPDCFDKVCTNFSMKVKAMGGFLCLIGKYWDVDVVEIWMMKEYGAKESWTKLMSLDRRESALPLAFSKNGDKVLMQMNYHPRSLVWYDLRSKMVEELKIEGVPILHDAAEMSVESLVPAQEVIDGSACLIGLTVISIVACVINFIAADKRLSL